MQMDSRSSHPRILRRRASEVFVDKSASGASQRSERNIDFLKTVWGPRAGIVVLALVHVPVTFFQTT